MSDTPDAHREPVYPTPAESLRDGDALALEMQANRWATDANIAGMVYARLERVGADAAGFTGLDDGVWLSGDHRPGRHPWGRHNRAAAR